MKLDPLDVLVSEFIRKRAIERVGGCERCLTPKHDVQKENGDIFPAWKQLQNSHYKGRAKKSTRWDEDNCAGLCGGCHRYLTSQPDEHSEWFKQRLGEEAYNNLMIRARTPAKYIDKIALKLYYKQKIADLKERNKV